jgi:hypothetical protein
VSASSAAGLISAASRSRLLLCPRRRRTDVRHGPLLPHSAALRGGCDRADRDQLRGVGAQAHADRAVRHRGLAGRAGPEPVRWRGRAVQGRRQLAGDADDARLCRRQSHSRPGRHGGRDCQRAAASGESCARLPRARGDGGAGGLRRGARHPCDRGFYTSLGHVAAEFEVPQMAIILRRGLVWAAR